MSFRNFRIDPQIAKRVPAKVGALLIALSFCSTAFAQDIPKELQDVGIVEKLGQSVSVHELSFADEDGKPVQLGEYFKKGHPVLLNVGYYGCATLCSFVLNGLLESLKKTPWVPGKQFELVSVTIDPDDQPALAKKKKANYIADYGRPEAAEGWHFLTVLPGREDQVRKLADQVGFRYKYDEQQKQYAHGAALFVLTPEGKISRYLYGIQYPEKDLRLALVEASNGKIGTVIDRILLFCYRYDPLTRKYSLYLSRLMQAGGAGTVFFFGAYLAVFWRRERLRGSCEGDCESSLEQHKRKEV